MLRDKDGNIYTSVVIGDLEILVQNLKVTHYADGTPIRNLQSDTDLELLTGWTNVDFDTFTSSSLDITAAIEGSGTQGSAKSNAITLKAGDTLYFKFNLTLNSGNLPYAVIYRNGTLLGSTIIVSGANSMNYSITSDGNYQVGFLSPTTGTDFSATCSVGSANNLAWEDVTTGAYCWYDNSIANKNTYGSLYNWYAVDNGHGLAYIERDGVFESGWRVVTDADIAAISTSLGGEPVAGGKMKEIGLSHWITPNTGADNSSGLNSVPSGFRTKIGSAFSNMGYNLVVWTQTSTGYFYLAYDDAAINYFSGRDNGYGHSVMLVSDYTGGGIEDPPTEPPAIGPGKVLTIGYEAVEFFDKFNITYSIGDIRDLSQGSSDKSYTIQLPLTKKNGHILKHLPQMDVKSEPVKRARIYMDELIIIQGKIYVLDYTDTYAKIIINSDDWIENLKSRKMSEIDLSAYDHLLTTANVEDSWSASNAVYRYPMIDFGALSSGETGLTATWAATDFIPMIRIVDLISKILYPFTVISNILDIEYITDLYILGREKIADENFVQGKHLEIRGDAYGDNTDTASIAAGSTGIAILTSHYVEFNDTVTDEYPSWDAITSEYTVPETGTYRFKATLELINTGNAAPFSEMAGQCTIYLLQSGSASNLLKVYYAPTGITAGTIVMDTGYVYLVAGDIIHLEITCYSRAKNNGVSSANLTVGLDVTSKLELIWNNPTRYKGINDMIRLSEYMPDMSQADFLGAIRDIFNLRFFMDKPRQTLYVEHWDGLFSSEVKDLSDIVDYSSLSDNPAELISNNYFRSTLMKWKDDSSDEAYNEHLRKYDSPLTKEIVLTSQFCKDGQDVKEHTWSTIVEGYNLILVDYTKQVPRLWDHLISYSEIDFKRKVNFNTRIVHWDGYVACSQSWVYTSGTKNYYPKISGISWPYVYSQWWQKIFHKIDKGKLYPVKIKVKPGLLTQFMTVINDVNAENYRPIYKIEIDGVDNYFRLQRITSDGEIAEIELILE